MNALSVEARQMVAAALNLVMKDIEQLRQVRDYKNVLSLVKNLKKTMLSLKSHVNLMLSFLFCMEGHVFLLFN